MASAQRRTFSSRSRRGKADAFMPSLVRATKPSQDFARALGAVWAGGSDERPPEALDAAITFAPVGALVPVALAAVKKGGRVVCGGIHMSDIPSFPYRLLWQERPARFRRQSHAQRRARVFGHRAARRHQNAGNAPSARAGQYRAERFAGRPLRGCRRAYSMTVTAANLKSTHSTMYSDSEMRDLSQEASAVDAWRPFQLSMTRNGRMTPPGNIGLIAGAATLALLGSAAIPIAAEVGLCSLVAKPANFDRQAVTLQGAATAVKKTTSRQGNNYTLFKLEDPRGCGAVNIFTWGHPQIQQR